jgi:PilZ domain
MRTPEVIMPSRFFRSLHASTAPAFDLFDNHARAADAELTRTLRVLEREARNISRLIATTTSALNMWAAQTDQFSEDLRAYLPADPDLYKGLAPRLPRLAIDSQTLELLQSFYARLALAKNLVLFFPARNSLTPPDFAAEITHVRDAWRGMSATAVDVVRELHTLIATRERNPSLPPHDALRALAAARDGHHAAMIAGRPSVMDWAERRRAPRVPIEMTAIVSIAGQHWPVTVTDVSRGGFGLDHAVELPRGRALRMRLDNGRSFEGQIAWIDGQRAGFMLAEDMNASDPLLNPARTLAQNP